jgi:energy-coupling factor transport system substrate-specific component
MSWQLVSFVLVAVALALGLWWYERTRPPATLVAVVATLAALAALGRDAFAALPDVKPTTAIVLIAGYTFGAPSGFAVGAFAALASNLELGQGPWTPWQMLAWGLVGVAGGVLARTTGRRLGRIALAGACALAAVGFEAIIDLYTWTGTGARSLAGYGVVVAQAFTFSATHVVASFAFGLAFGPALARMLLRVRARLEVRWRPAGALPLLVLGGLTAAAFVVLAGGGPPPARAAAPSPASVSAGSPAAPSPASVAGGVGAPEVAYLRAAQNPDGGFGASPGQSSSELYTAWAAMGLAAAGVDPASVRRDGHSVLDALRTGAAQLSGLGDDERTILALRAADAPIGSFPGPNLVTSLLAGRSPDGSFGDQVNTTAFAIFALRAAGMAAGAPVIGRAGRWLARQQNADGGFSFAQRGAGSDSDDTAAAVQGVVDSLGRTDGAVARAIGYLRRQQNPDGGWSLSPGATSDAQSTAWTIQALDAAGLHPSGVRRAGGRSAVGFLQTLVGPDGSVHYSRTSSQTPVWVTAQALTALAAAPFPIEPPAARRAAVGAATGATATRASGATGAPAATGAPPDEEAIGRDIGLFAGALLGVLD